MIRRALALVIVGMITLNAWALTQQDYKKSFADDDPAVRQEAYAALKAAEGEERTLALTTLQEVYAKELASYEKSISAVRNVLKGYGSEGGEQKVLKMFESWMRAREMAFEKYMDQQLFPFPGMTEPVTGPYKGYDKVMPYVDKALGASKGAVGIGKAAAKKMFSKGFRKKLISVDEDAALLAEYSEMLAELDAEHTAFTPANIDFFRAGALMGEGKYAEGVKYYTGGTLNKAEKIAFFFIHAEARNMYNYRNPNGHNGGEMKAIHALNELRVGLGASPYETDPSLAKAIDDHIKWCGSNGGISHFGPEGAKTAHERCAKAGYKGSVSENMTSAGAMFGVMTGWKYDGGHFRNMVSPGFNQIGMGQGAGAGFNNGFSRSPNVPEITPVWLEGKTPQQGQGR